MAMGVLCLGATAALAQGDPRRRRPRPAAAPAAPATGPEAEIARVSAPVELDGTTLFHVRGVALYPADERARQISERVEEVARTWTIPVEAVRAAPEEYVVNIVAANRFLMLVTDADARIEEVDRRVLARAVVERIQRGIRAYRAARQPEAFARGAWRAAGATALLVAALAAFLWVVRRLEALFGRRYESKISSLQFQSFEILRAQRVRAAARALLRASARRLSPCSCTPGSRPCSAASRRHARSRAACCPWWLRRSRGCSAGPWGCCRSSSSCSSST